MFPQFANRAMASVSLFTPLLFVVFAVASAFGGGKAAGGDAEDLSKLLTLIRNVEAPAGYDDYYRGVSSPPPKALTSMTVGEVLDWQGRIDARSISEASGGYQIMEDTLRDLVGRNGIDAAEPFSPQLQDFLATRLLDQIGWGSYRRGEISPRIFGNRLAGVWAGFPLLSGRNRGQSAYDGLAGNRALISADVFEQALVDLPGFELPPVDGVGLSGGTPSRKAIIKARDPGFAPSVVITWASDPFYQD